MDHLALALTELGNISERRIMRLTDSDANGGVLPAFLTQNGGLNSGFMIVQYTAAALCTENKVLAHPASADTIPSSMNVEDHVSMGMTAGMKLKTVSANVADVIALELMCAAQGIDFRRTGGKVRLGEGTADIYDSIRQTVPFIEKDVALKPHIEALRALVTAMINS
jgi:histidine ammonia-lyase